MSERYTIRLDSNACHDSIPPFYVTLTSGVDLPLDATFDIYEKLTPSHTIPNRSFVAHTDKPLEFVGTSIHDSISSGTKYYVGLVNKTTKLVNLFPTSLLHMERVLKRDLEDDEENEENNTNSNQREQRVALGSTFGTKKAKKMLDSVQKNRIQADALEETASVLSKSVTDATDSMQSRRLSHKQSDNGPDLPLLPRYNDQAQKPVDVYPRKFLFPPELERELSALAEPLKGLTSDAVRKFHARFNEPPLCPPEFLCQGSPLALYYHFLAKLLQINRRQYLTADAVSQFLGCSDRVAHLLVTCLFVHPKSSSHASPKQRLTPHLKLRVTFFAIVTGLHMYGFSINPTFLGDTLKISPTAAGKYARQCGCLLEYGEKASKVQSNLKAVLKAPLVLPDLQHSGLKQRK